MVCELSFRIKMQALFLHTMWVDNGIMFSDSWAMRFLCVASAAHFLFYGGIIKWAFQKTLRKQEEQRTFTAAACRFAWHESIFNFKIRKWYRITARKNTTKNMWDFWCYDRQPAQITGNKAELSRCKKKKFRFYDLSIDFCVDLW